MAAQQTTDAFFGIAVRSSRLFVPLHRLMTAVEAGNVATTAADAFFLINMRVDDIAAVEIFCRNDIGIRQPHHLIQRVETLIVKIVRQATDHIFNDAIAVLHDASGHLQRCRA